MSGHDSSGRPANGDLCRSHPELRKEKCELIADLAIEMDVEKSFDIPGLVACLDGGNVFSRHSDGMDPRQTRTHSGVLRDQARHERVLENVERFIQVRTGMQRRDTGTKANSILRNRWIIHRSDPEPSAAQFMTEAVHSLAVTDHERHHVSSRVPRIDAEPPEL